MPLTQVILFRSVTTPKTVLMDTDNFSFEMIEDKSRVFEVPIKTALNSCCPRFKFEATVHVRTIRCNATHLVRRRARPSVGRRRYFAERTASEAAAVGPSGAHYSHADGSGVRHDGMMRKKKKTTEKKNKTKAKITERALEEAQSVERKRD